MCALSPLSSDRQKAVWRIVAAQEVGRLNRTCLKLFMTFHFLGTDASAQVGPWKCQEQLKENFIKVNQRHANWKSLLSVLRFITQAFSVYLVFFRLLPSPDMCIVCLTKIERLLHLLCGLHVGQGICLAELLQPCNRFRVSSIRFLPKPARTRYFGQQRSS